MTDEIITIHTDGSCQGNPGNGGCAAVVRYYEGLEEASMQVFVFHEAMTTNIRMEMKAAILGLQQISPDEPTEITVFTGSAMLIQGMTEWVNDWKENGWRKAKGKPVSNRALSEELLTLTDGLNVRWAHDLAGDPRNKEVKEMAKTAASRAA